MSEYKIVASDLDGTLLNSKSEITKENIDAINKLCQKGIFFVPSTGRTLSEIPSDIKNLSCIRYFIYANGAAVLDRTTGNRVLNCISDKDGRYIFDILKSFEAHVSFRTDGQCYVDSRFQNDADFEYYNVCEAHRVVVRNFAEYSDDFENISQNADDIEVISAFFHSYQDKIKCRELIEKNSALKAVEVSEYNLEIINTDAGKGNALGILSEMTGVPCERIISIGDSDNDSSIIKAAGLGLAVSNSCEELKIIADEIICSNDEHVVEYVLKHYA
ncbi:MAG: Cof-type HAD-IIB family hydrolase [Ruminococcaceae bacterium]|nr:Cof-type HAD-IIB family hydrolase [Oscillospiraceae bacterium]